MPVPVWILWCKTSFASTAGGPGALWHICSISLVNVYMYIYLLWLLSLSWLALLRALRHELSLIRAGGPAPLAWQSPLSPISWAPRSSSDRLLCILFCRKGVMVWCEVLTRQSRWFGTSQGGVLSTWLSVAGGQPRSCDVGGMTQGKLARSHSILFSSQKKSPKRGHDV